MEWNFYQPGMGENLKATAHKSTQIKILVSEHSNSFLYIFMFPTLEDNHAYGYYFTFLLC